MSYKIDHFLRSIPDRIETATGDMAFPISAAPGIMEAALQNNWVILGGDVLTMQLEYAYANWYYEPERMLSLKENVKLSVQKSQQYISKFSERNGDSFLLIFTISDSYVAGNGKYSVG